MTLPNRCFELDGLEWGEVRAVFPETFAPGSTEVRVQDSVDSTSNSKTFGVDRETPGSWSWTLCTTADREADAFDQIAPYATLWRRLRRTPRQVWPLRYTLGHRTRLVYGRPRRFDTVDFDPGLGGGRLKAVADFVLADTQFYGEEESVLSLTLDIPRVGGLTLPARTPWVFNVNTGPVQGVAYIGGTTATWALIEMRGPVTNPGLNYFVDSELVWSVRYAGTLRYDEVLVIDPRPWASTAMVDGTRSVAGNIRGSRLYELTMAPGAAEMVYSGIDMTRSSTCRVRWRSAYDSI